MLNKFLLVGVGGSGGKTLRYTWHELDRRLKAAGWNGGVPDAWQFLHIDVPERPDIVEGDVPADIGVAARYVGLASNPNLYPIYDGRLLKRGPIEGLAGWRADPSRRLRPVWNGAGQRRVVGRVVTLAEIRRVGRALDDALSAMNSQPAGDALDALNLHLGADEAAEAEPTAVVFSSISGGSGSGGYLDVVELLKGRATDAEEWLDSGLVTVLFGPDTFMHLDRQDRRGVEPNAAAAMSEFLAADAHEGDVSALEDELLAEGGAVRDIQDARTGTATFIVGARNKGLAFDHGNQVFRAVGKAFAAFMAVDTIQTRFHHYILNNADGLAPVEDFVLTPRDAVDNPVSSFGYANVSLGRALFSRYAEERMAKVVLNRLLHGHFQEAGPDAAQNRSAPVVVREIVERYDDDFFRDCNLFEVGTGNDQVLDALRSIPETKARLDALASRLLADIRSSDRRTTGEKWWDSVRSAFDAEVLAFKAKEQEERETRARKWVIDIQQQLLETTATYVGLHGLWVTSELLKALGDQLEQAARDLERDEASFTGQSGGFIKQIRTTFHKLRDVTIGASHDSFKNAATWRRDAAQRECEASLYALTAELLREIRTDVLPSLIRTLEVARTTLLAELDDNQRLQKTVDQWSATGVPSHLRAAKNESLLEDESKFEEKMDTLLFELDGPAGEGVRTGIVEIISGRWQALRPDESSEMQQLIKSPHGWRPQNRSALSEGDRSRAPEFRMALTHLAVLGLARKWVTGRSPFAEYGRGSLAAWLDPTLKDAADHANRFVVGLDRALKRSAPLVTVNTKAHEAVYGDAPVPPRMIVGPIPMAVDHPAYDRVCQVLSAAGIPETQIPTYFEPASDFDAVEISTFLGAAVHPIVLGSLMVPIQRDWKNRNRAEQQKFWDYRRARQLPSFVPIGETRQHALIRGWLTARMLGYMAPLAGRWSDQRRSVWTPRGPVLFPEYLLGNEPTNNASVLPALFESMILAIVSYSSGDTEELAAYTRLLTLGAQPDGIDASYTQINTELSHWIRSGRVVEPDPDKPAPSPVPAAIAGPADGTPEERRDALLAWVTTFRDGYAASASKFRATPETTLRTPRGWEIRDLVATSTRAMLAALEIADLEPETADQDGFTEEPMGV